MIERWYLSLSHFYNGKVSVDNKVNFIESAIRSILTKLKLDCSYIINTITQIIRFSTFLSLSISLLIFFKNFLNLSTFLLYRVLNPIICILEILCINLFVCFPSSDGIRDLSKRYNTVPTKLIVIIFLT